MNPFFFANRIIFASIEFNPMHGLEEPHEASFAASKPISMKEMTTEGDNPAGMMKPKGATFADGTHGIVKTDSSSSIFEPMAYQLGKRLNVNVPKTVTRKIGSKAASVQQRVPGTTYENLNNDEQEHVRNHPDFHKNSMFDWLTGNSDRHHGNSMYDTEQDRVHAIDNGQIGSYFTHRPDFQSRKGDIVNVDPQGNIDFNLRESNPSAPIPADFRDAVMKADPAEHQALMQSFLSHPNFQNAVNARKKNAVDPHWYTAMNGNGKDIGDHIASHYGDRLRTLKKHFGDDNVQTMKDLYGRLYPQQ